MANAAATQSSVDIVPAVLDAFSANNRFNKLLLQNVAGVWTTATPGGQRTICEIAAHIQNVRVMWLSQIPGIEVPSKLEGMPSPEEVIGALDKSYELLDAALAKALSGDNQLAGFEPDAVSFAFYIVAHDAHHRGQIALLARVLGSPLPKPVGFGLWDWSNEE